MVEYRITKEVICLKRNCWLWGFFSTLLCIALLSACVTDASQQSTETGNQQQGEEMGSSDSLMISSEQGQAFAQGLNINSAPVDLSDLAAVTAVYVSPLPNHCYLYGWDSASEITADHLIEACAKENFLHLPRDIEGVYLPEVNKPAAEDVEKAIQKHFDVDADYLRTAKWYEFSEDEVKQENTYFLIGGFGGGWSGVAIAAEQTGNRIIIEIAIEKSMDMSITPVGTMTVELTPDNVVRYISYEYTNASFSF